MKPNQIRWLAGVAFLAYAALLIRLVVFKKIPVVHIGHMRFRFAGTHTGPANLVPFRTIVPEFTALFADRGNHLIAMVNLLGNILPFMPIGVLAPLIVRSVSWRKALALGFFTGLTCEVLEVVFRVGIFDVDDILLNAIGVLLGYGVWAMFHRRAQTIM